MVIWNYFLFCFICCLHYIIICDLVGNLISFFLNLLITPFYNNYENCFRTYMSLFNTVHRPLIVLYWNRGIFDCKMTTNKNVYLSFFFTSMWVLQLQCQFLRCFSAFNVSMLSQCILLSSARSPSCASLSWICLIPQTWQLYGISLLRGLNS